MTAKSAVIAGVFALLLDSHPVRAESVVMAKISYGGWPACIRLRNPEVELVVGCNNATFTNADMIEIESLGPLITLAPEGKAECTEHWFLYRKEVGHDEVSIDSNLLPLVKQTETSRP